MYNQYEQAPAVDTQQRLHRIMAGTYLWMFISLLVSAVSSFIFANTALVSLATHGLMIFLVLFAVQLVIIFCINKVALKNPTFAKILLTVFSITDGILLSGIFVIYSPKLIMSAFLATAVPFGTMSFIGYKSKKDYQSWYPPLMGCVVGIIIVSIIEMLFHNPMVVLFVDIASIVVFTILTMVDTNHIKQLANKTSIPEEAISVTGALSLYLDFINLFMDILDLFSRD